jgi:hypothetical protein
MVPHMRHPVAVQRGSAPHLNALHQRMHRSQAFVHDRSCELVTENALRPEQEGVHLAHGTPQLRLQGVLRGVQQVDHVAERQGELMKRLRQGHRQDEVAEHHSCFSAVQADTLTESPANLSYGEPLLTFFLVGHWCVEKEAERA